MIVAQWTCEVPREKRAALIRFVTSEIREIYRAKGCVRHELHSPVASERKYFPFHEDLEPSTYVERLSFPDVTSWERFLEAMEADPTARAAANRYEADFRVSNCSFTLLREEP